MDRRLTFATDRVAHVSLQGRIDAPAFAESKPAEIALPLVDLLNAPGGMRERQLLLGHGFDVLENRDGHAFGRAVRDGYCGWVSDAALTAVTGVSHWVAAPASHLYDGPKVQARNLASLSFGAHVRVLGQEGAFAQTPYGYVPAGHLQPLGRWFPDPVEVAGLFLGVPYLWGGNSHAGLDCSGLVQMSLLACGLPCPGDSDLQRAVGVPVVDAADLQRGDLVFWKGHVAMMVDPDTIIHSTGHFMATVIEPLAVAMARIKDQTGLDVIARRRP